MIVPMHKSPSETVNMIPINIPIEDPAVSFFHHLEESEAIEMSSISSVPFFAVRL
jgi:hypothetical protein